MAKAKRLLGDATPEEKEFCAWSATVTAGATGEVGKPQIALLEGIYDALGVPRAALYVGLHAGIGAAAVDAEEPVLVSEEVAGVAHAIPRPPSATGPEPDRLARIRAETEQVSAMLAKIFVEDEPSQDAAGASGDGPFGGLDAEHSGLLQRLMVRAEWHRAEFDALASELGLMPDGALETINEWALDHHGAALVEDGDPLMVNLALLPIDPEAVAAL